MDQQSKRILALDLGTTTGWAFGACGKEPISGVWKNKHKAGAANGAKFLSFKNNMDTFYNDSGGIDFVVYENVKFVPRDKRGQPMISATQVWSGYLAIMLCWCEQNAIPYHGVAVQTIKKFATGNGNATKAKMMRMFRLQVGRDPIDDNEADAYHILKYGQHMSRSAWMQAEGETK